MRTNLVNHDIYKFPADSEQSAADIKAKMSEKLKYVLSEKDSYDPHEGLMKMPKAKNIVIHQRYIEEEKIKTYGGKIADPFKLNIHESKEVEGRVFTS